MGIYSPYSYHLLAKRHNEVRLYTRRRGRRNPFLLIKSLTIKIKPFKQNSVSHRKPQKVSNKRKQSNITYTSGSGYWLGAQIRPGDSFSLGLIPGRPTRWRDTFRFEPLSVSLLSWKLFA